MVIEPGNPIRIGTLLTSSGKHARLGLDSRRGVELAIEERGPVLGRRVERIHEDERCNARGARAGAERLVRQRGLVAVVGTNCSSTARAAAQVLGKAHVLLVSPSNTAPDLTARRGGLSFYARTAHNDGMQGEVAAIFARRELGSRTAATVTDGSSSASALATRFSRRFRRLGGTVERLEITPSTGASARKALSSVSSPDVLYLPVSVQTGVAVIRTAASLSALDDMDIVGTDALFSRSFIRAAEAAGTPVYISGPDLTGFQGSDRYEEFLRVFYRRFAEEPQSVFHVHAYDAANLIIDSIESASIVETETKRLLISRSRLFNKILSTKNYEGLSGTLTCDRFGDCGAAAPMTVHEVACGFDLCDYWRVAADGEVIPGGGLDFQLDG